MARVDLTTHHPSLNARIFIQDLARLLRRHVHDGDAGQGVGADGTEDRDHFGEFHGTVLDTEGNVVDEFVDEGDVPKGQSAKNKSDILECTFSFTEVSDGSDPEFPEGYTFIGEGEVRVFATPPS